MAIKIEKGDQWIYHPEHGARLIYLADIGDLLDNGWCFSPDDFPKEGDEADKVELSKSDLYAYSKELGLKLDWKITRGVMISQIEEHLNGNG